ncbi:MAG: hypothetical protein U9P79_03375 [Candidatus Cloacimonadota bacterium]|nr:hypothetical protein [Candidatus Cloacimonadota bacterium]
MNKLFLMPLIFLICLSTFHPLDAEITHKYADLQDYAIFNENTGKIFKYKLIFPNNSTQLQIDNCDSAKIYTRLITDTDKNIAYTYKLILNNSIEKIIHKSANISQISKGLSGDNVTSYNKYLCFFSDSSNSLQFFNDSDYKILLKIKYESLKALTDQYKYISFPIRQLADEDEKILAINEQKYTYYSANSKSVKFTLIGPFKLKIVSRIIIDSDDISDKFRYRFDVYDNEKLVEKFIELAFRSSEAILTDTKAQIPSTGDINILTFENGLHNIEIKNPNVNREVIFSVYLNKVVNSKE